MAVLCGADAIDHRMVAGLREKCDELEVNRFRGSLVADRMRALFSPSGVKGLQPVE